MSSLPSVAAERFNNHTMRESALSHLRLRPGAQVFEVSADELHVRFPNYTATFTSTQVVKGIHALLTAFVSEDRPTEVVHNAARATGLEPEFLEYLIELLQQTNCLFRASDRVTSSKLAEFVSYLGDDPQLTLERLAQSEPLLITPVSAQIDLADVLRAAGLQGEVFAVEPGSTCGVVLDDIRARLSHTQKLRPLACWGFPYLLPFARMLNDLALEEKVPVVFGGCEGVFGRIGPYVIPHNTACLECANLRILSHAGESERRVFSQYRARFEDSIPGPDPTHPVFHDAILRLFILEVVQIIRKLPPRTIGGMIEYNFSEGSAQRRPIFKVPRCPACYTARPERLAWDIQFTAPVVKGANE